MSYQSVFHPSDFTAGDHAAFVHSLKIALAAKGELELLHVDEPGVKREWNEFPHVRKTLAQWGVLSASAHREEVRALGLHARKVTARSTQVETAIIEHIMNREPDLVVLATHQRSGPSRWLHRTLAEPVSRQARVKTLFVPRRIVGCVSPETGIVRLENILIPDESQPDSQAAITAATGLAKLLGCEQVRFEILHVGSADSQPELDLPQSPGWTWNRSVRQGDPVEEILAAADVGNADLVVMATEGRRGFLDTLRGTVTERVLHGVRCPLLAVPSN